MPDTINKELVSSSLIHKLEPLSLRAKGVVEGFLTGLHKSPYHGFSVEFSEHRMYQPGDSLRHLDWRVYGRSDRFYIKQYQEETNLRSNILLDISGSMGFKSQNSHVTKFEYSRTLAASLIYLLLLQRDAVGLTLCDTEIKESLPPRSATIWRNELWKHLENAIPGGDTALGPILHSVAEKSGRRGLIIMISDLFDDADSIINGLHHFRHLGHEILLFHVLDPIELTFDFKREALFKELEGGGSMVVDPWQVKEGYRDAMSDHIKKIREGCSKHNIHHHLLQTDTPLEEALVSLLLKRKRQL